MKNHKTGNTGSFTVRLYSDFACPYCFIAEQSSLVKLQNEYDVGIDWRGFELQDTRTSRTSLGGKFNG